MDLTLAAAARGDENETQLRVQCDEMDVSRRRRREMVLRSSMNYCELLRRRRKCGDDDGRLRADIFSASSPKYLLVSARDFFSLFAEISKTETLLVRIIMSR